MACARWGRLHPGGVVALAGQDPRLLVRAPGARGARRGGVAVAIAQVEQRARCRIDALRLLELRASLVDAALFDQLLRRGKDHLGRGRVGRRGVGSRGRGLERAPARTRPPSFDVRFVMAVLPLPLQYIFSRGSGGRFRTRRGTRRRGGRRREAGATAATVAEGATLGGTTYGVAVGPGVEVSARAGVASGAGFAVDRESPNPASAARGRFMVARGSKRFLGRRALSRCSDGECAREEAPRSSLRPKIRWLPERIRRRQQAHPPSAAPAAGALHRMPACRTISSAYAVEYIIRPASQPAKIS